MTQTTSSSAGASPETPFEKEADDARYHHRDAALNAYYADRLDFDAGDEQLQIGRYNAKTLLKYALRRGKPAGRKQRAAA